MTTAYAWFVRGRLLDAWRANPAGLLIAALSVPTIPWLLAASARGRAVGTRSVGGPLMGLAVGASAFAVLTWAVRRALSLA